MARYDEHAAWYDEFASTASFAEVRDHAVALLGPASGRCLDLACGSGLALPLLAAAGWDVTGIDVSQEQLELARERAAGATLLRGDAHEIPFDDGAFDAVVSLYSHTDFEDVRGAFREAARVLRAGGVFVYAGVHPCFASPFAKPMEDGTILLEPGYRRAEWMTVSRYPDRPGIRARVGVNHVPLSTLLNAVIDAGFVLTRFDEPRVEDPPGTIALRAVKP